jgi:putative sigma-54 modulation protein
MKITFTGKRDKLTPSQERKLAMAFGRLSKQLERKGEKAAHVAFSDQRHLKIAELRLNYYGHPLVASGSGSDQYTAVMDALEKVEKQVLKNRAKWRETKRETPTRMAKVGTLPIPLPEPAAEQPAPPKQSGKAKKGGRPVRVVQASAGVKGKPMTFEEAVMALDEDQDYMVYRDAETDKISVVVRRRDGMVDLIEA